MSKGSVAVRVNKDVGHYFQTKKGVRQGDPLSPMLFNMAVDVLAILIQRAKRMGLFKGVLPNLVEEGLSILQYADDTIILLQHNFEEARNLKLLLCAFEQLSGLKINFHKSELFCYGDAKNRETHYSDLFGCELGVLPFCYIGITMHHKKILNVDWRVIEERFQKRLSGWKSKLLSVGGRLTLLNSILSSLPMFMLSFFEIPKGVLEKLDSYRSKFFGKMRDIRRNIG